MGFTGCICENYSAIQNLPYYFGFIDWGMLMLVSATTLITMKKMRKKFHLLVALGGQLFFVRWISFNYICQTTFIHNLALHYKPEYDSVISAFSMSNPLSYCWANEMWGYGLLGLATLLMSGYYAGKNNLIRWLLIINGIGSLFGAIWIIIDVSWVMTIIGMIAYVVWNVLMIVLIIRIYYFSKKSIT
jgi:hypothetical protein